MSKVVVTEEQRVEAEDIVSEYVNRCGRTFVEELIVSLYPVCSGKFLSEAGKKAKEAGVAVLEKEIEKNLRAGIELLKKRDEDFGLPIHTGTSISKGFKERDGIILPHTRWQKINSKFLELSKSASKEELEAITLEDCEPKVEVKAEVVV